ncbi:MAG: ABC transporter substrate-binding protein [Cryobacterium sp.]|nr:ABC transporter substrate-binding protein [Cryobacterium sp.]
MRSKRLIAGVAALATAVTLLAGCSTESAPPNETTPVQGISKDKVVKVGAFIAQSGPLAIVKAIKDAAALKFDEVNKAGGVNGYTFDYVALDDQADPAQTVTAVKQLWEQDKVFALFMPYGSGSNNAAKEYVLENKIPLLFPFASADIYLKKGETPPENVFGFFPPYGDFLSGMIAYAQSEKKVKTIAVVHTNDDTGMTSVTAIKAIAAQLGLEVVDDIGFDATETNFAPIGRRVAESRADATVLWAITGSTEILDAAESSGYKGLWFGQDGFRGGIYLKALQDHPDLANRFFLSTYLSPASSPESKEFLKAWKAAYPNEDPEFSQPGWVAASLLVDAVKKATAKGKALDWPTLQAALNSYDNASVAGVQGVTWNAESHWGITKIAIWEFNGDSFDVTSFETAPSLK